MIISFDPLISINPHYTVKVLCDTCYSYRGKCLGSRDHHDIDVPEHQLDSNNTYLSRSHTPGYPMPLPIVRLVLICKTMDFAHKATESAWHFVYIVMGLTLDLVFTKYQADLRCLANQNKPDNGQRHRVF